MSLKLIILVENDFNLRQSIALILQRAGYVVTPTDCVDKAMDLLHSGKYHLLISDINIPDITTVLLPTLLEQYPRLPIVILTDQSATEVERQSKLYKAYYLIKPIAPEKLLDFVGSLLNKKNNTDYVNNHGMSIDSSHDMTDRIRGY